MSRGAPCAEWGVPQGKNKYMQKEYQVPVVCECGVQRYCFNYEGLCDEERCDCHKGHKLPEPPSIDELLNHLSKKTGLRVVEHEGVKCLHEEEHDCHASAEDGCAGCPVRL